MLPPLPGHPLLLLWLLLAAAPCPSQPWGSCPLPCRCRRRLLDCRHAGLAIVPAATRRWALSILDFTGNSISSIEEQAWREYPWAEYLVLQDNDVRAVKRHSLEGLLLLKHLDLSCNKILSIEEHAFEPLPFLQLINLGGNLITQIQNGTFQAWHGLQFLQKLILSHNPLSVIADTSFFELPSVKYLDLSATQVTQQTLLTLLLTTVCLEMLKLPSDTACCLCREKRPIETLCRTIEFRCENLCSTSAPQCAHTDPLAETQGEIVEAIQSRKLNASSMLNVELQKPSLRDHETVTLVVVLRLTSTDGDLSKPNDHISRTNSYSPQHLSRQEGKTTKALVAKLKKNLRKSKITMTMKNSFSPLPAPAVLKDEVHEIPEVEGEATTGWMQKQHDLGLDGAALNPGEAAGRLNPTDKVSVFRHHKTSMRPSERSLLCPPAESPHLSGSFRMQNYLDEKTHGTVDVEDVEDAEEAPSPRQGYVWVYRKHKQGDSPYLNKSDQLFYTVFGNVKEEPTPTANKTKQRLSTNQGLFYNRSVKNSHSVTSSVQGDVTEEEGSSLGGHLSAVPRTTETPWKQKKGGSSFHNKTGSSDSPDGTLAEGGLFETKVNRHLRVLVPDEALRAFIAHVARALRMDCNLPELQLGCAKMISKTGLLVKLLSEKQDDQRASTLLGQCLLEGNVSNGMGLARKEPESISGKRLLLALSVSGIITINLMVICLTEVCSTNPAASSRPRSASNSRPRCFFQKLLPRGWRMNKNDVTEEESGGCDRSKITPQWLRDLYLPLGPQDEELLDELDDEETSEEEEIFNKSELNRKPAAPQDHGDGSPHTPTLCGSDEPHGPEQGSLSMEEKEEEKEEAVTGSSMPGAPPKQAGDRGAAEAGEPV